MGTLKISVYKLNKNKKIIIKFTSCFIIKYFRFMTLLDIIKKIEEI